MFWLLLLLCCCVRLPASAPALELAPGTHFAIEGRTATVQSVQMLPFVESEYTKRFKFDSAANPKLVRLRERYHLEEVVAPGANEFEKQILLNDWVHRQFKKFGRPSSSARGGLEILEGIQRGDTFFCAQYAELLVSAAASLGWNDRLLALRRHQGVNARGGSTEHSTTEIWSNQYAKWVMLDPTSNLYLERGGLPLNAWEIREEWFYRGGTNLVFVAGKERKRYRKRDLPIYLDHFSGFGDLTFDPDELDKYGFVGYIPNTDLMDSGNDYGQMFIIKDQLCAGTQWHQRTNPRFPATEPYFPINQATIQLSSTASGLEVRLATFTPNFQTFEVQFGPASWKATGNRFARPLHPGTNILSARAVNQFGIKGPEASVRVLVK